MGVVVNCLAGPTAYNLCDVWRVVVGHFQNCTKNAFNLYETTQLLLTSNTMVRRFLVYNDVKLY